MTEGKKPTYVLELEHRLKKVEELLDELLLQSSNTLERKPICHHTNADVDDSNLIIDDLMGKIKGNRVYNKYIGELKQVRLSMMGKMTIEDYASLCRSQIELLKTIFLEKGYNNKKTLAVIGKGLSSLETRLLQYGTYYNEHLLVDEIETLERSLESRRSYAPQEYVVFNESRVCEDMYNYGSVLFNFRSNISRVLFNMYGYSNIVYLPLPQSLDSDPYSFYYLDKVDKDKRFWKMDCRLEDFTNVIISNMLPYLIGMFRKLYFDVFSDNDYRKEYHTRCQVTECDCEQLLHNIILLADTKKTCVLVQKLVRENSTYKVTKNDKFNIYSDDALQKERYSSTNENIIDDIPLRLFDKISLDDELILKLKLK